MWEAGTTTRLVPGEIKTGYLLNTRQLLHHLSQVALYLISCCISGTSPDYVLTPQRMIHHQVASRISCGIHVGLRLYK
jgi:hypothetical protein